MTEAEINGRLALSRRLTCEVLAPMKEAFVGKDEVIDLLGVCLVAGENLFILGPPGTAKSALVQDLARRLDGQCFDYLLTRFTEKPREGELVTNTEGGAARSIFLPSMWPQAGSPADDLSPTSCLAHSTSVFNVAAGGHTCG